MGRLSFVAWLFVAAIASLAIAIGDRSFGWFALGVVLMGVAAYARKRLREEAADGQRNTASLGFLGGAIGLMVLAMLFIFWLQSRAA